MLANNIKIDTVKSDRFLLNIECKQTAKSASSNDNGQI